MVVGPSMPCTVQGWSELSYHNPVASSPGPTLGLDAWQDKHKVEIQT